jgi:hypothetical protein
MDEYLVGIMNRRSRNSDGLDSRYRWVEPGRKNRTKEESPYGYSDHYLWGERQGGCSAVYSDRLAQWDAAKASAARDAVANYGARYGYWGKEGTSKYLSAYFGRPIEAVAVAEGCNVSNGFPYWVFWFRDVRSPQETEQNG